MLICIIYANSMHFLGYFKWGDVDCERQTSRVNLAPIAKSQGGMPHLCPTPFNEFAYDPMSKTTSDLSSHTPMMQQYGLEQCVGRQQLGLQRSAV
ncbi:hypothetical protein H096_16183 [Pseudomonas sp. FH1]|nr:hypothetical protein H096_16183 [Pseudomonas sp. FH1]